MKNKYDSSIVFLYATGNEHLLPEEFRKQIPYTTIFGWRRTNFDQYLGHEFRYFFDEAFESADLKYRYSKLKRTMYAFVRSWVLLQEGFLPLLKSASKDKEKQKKILKAINYLQVHFGLDQTLKIFGLSKNLYQQWVLVDRFNCFDSFASLCVKRHPQQMEIKEIEKMKKMLLDPAYDHWPIVSIAGYALRKKKIVASLFSWYKYANMFGHSKKLVKKDRKTIGLIATWPNEYLHVDTTYYPLVDGRHIYIAFVMDNYSKMILGLHVAERRDFNLVRTALENAMEVIMTHHDQQHSFLVADGGKENHNHQIDKYITELIGHKMTKIRALKDIHFSNSPVEAIHRTIKGRYLRNRKFDTLESIHTFLKWAMNDYNILRPHYKHRPRTPHEVYFDKKLGFDIQKRVKKAVNTRIINNRCSNCMQCSGFCRKDKPLKPKKKK